MLAERKDYPSIDAASQYWADRSRVYGPTRIGASFTWMKKFKSVAQAKAQFDKEENGLLNHFMEFLHYIRNLTGQHGELKVLETGCGAGNLTVRLAEEGTYLIDGIDICLPLVKHNRDRLSEAGFPGVAERINYGLAQSIRPFPNKRHPPPKFFDDESLDMMVWGKLDHKLLGWFYPALDQALEVLKEGSILAVYSVERPEKEPIVQLHRAKPSFNQQEYNQWAWERDDSDYDEHSERRKSCEQSYLVPLGQRWTHRNCGRMIFFRAWQKCTPRG